MAGPFNWGFPLAADYHIDYKVDAGDHAESRGKVSTEITLVVGEKRLGYAAKKEAIANLTTLYPITWCQQTETTPLQSC